MKKPFGCLIIALLSTQYSIAATILEDTASAKTRAEACYAATKRAEAGMYGFLESQGRIQEVRKSCECDKDDKGTWSCMATIAYTEKK